MSGNQKQTATGGPQTQRYSNSPYVTNGPVKQEGICLLPPPHYRMMPPQRADGFQVSTPAGAYVAQQPNQGGNQGPGLRSIAPTVPPNQASTPPNTDIKVQTLPQQQSMNHMFVQQPVRSGQGSYFSRAAGPASQTQRMPNHNNRPPQPIYGQQTPYVQIPTMYLPNVQSITANVPYYGQRPPGFVQPTLPLYSGQHLTSYQYSGPPTQAPASVNYYYNQQMLQRTGGLQQAQPTNPNTTQATIQNVPLVSNPPQHPPYPRQQLVKQRRPKAISIIDPDTGADRLNEIFDDNSHPPSGESSARQTPQPAPIIHEMRAVFNKQVLQAIHKDAEDVHIDDTDHHDPSVDHIDHSPYPPPPQAVQSTNRYEHLAQSSNLKVQAKEFVLPSSTPKETPIVSANCDAVEVTLPNKSPKDRESPAKGRKQREQSVREHKDSFKETILFKDPCSDKQSSIVKDIEVKPKETIPSNSATNVPQVPAPSKDSNKENLTHDKRAPKKDNKIESKVPSVELDESTPVAPAPVQPIPPAQEVNSSAKSKQNAQRVAQKQNVAQNNAPKPVQVLVPSPQPAKANNKSHKKNEINQKGANKEGTDMDAFNDNVVDKEEVNANITTSPVDNDIINANSVPVTNNATAIPRDVNVNIETNNKKIEISDVATIASQPVKVLKTKIDVTDIVKEKPKPTKPFNVEGFFEGERVVFSSDKLVQAKNEANAKVTSENNGNEPKLIYSKTQWSPSNPEGAKRYEREFLIALREYPESKKLPDYIPEYLLADDRGRLSDGRSSMGGRTDFTNPPFANYGGKSSSQRGLPPKRNSQSKLSDRGGQKGSRPSVKVSISVRMDVQLHETENAWRPARLVKSECATDDDKKTAELYKKVRGVLNKLTPQKFVTLLSQIKNLQIDTAERLQGVIDLVFEKAVDEPNFSVAYALMCKELALMQVPTSSSTEEKPEFVNFRKLLITRCQYEFEKQSVDESIRNEKLKEIEATAEPEKKKDLQFELAEYDRRLRMKSVGNIRFIGELFKQNMLTVNIMMRCLNNLLENKDEESLECLCKLLTTIGKELEQQKQVVLVAIFGQMKNIVDKKEGKVSSRIRFMLQDVIDLRNSKWKPRRQDLDPKTIDQIQKEAETEQINIQYQNSIPMTPRKDDRGGSGSHADRKGRGRNVTADDGWTVNTNRNRSQFTVQSDKLKNRAPLNDEPFGSSLLFGNWSKGSVGSSIKPQPQSLGPNTANMYAPLENMEMEKRPLSSRPGSKDPYSSKGPSLERNFPKSYDGRGSRSGSQHRSNDSSGSSSQRSTPAPVIPPQVAPKVPQMAPPPVPQLTEEQMERRIHISLDEYVTGSLSEEEFFLEINSAIPLSYYPKMIQDSYSRVLEKSQHARLKTASLFVKLIKAGNIQLDDYCAGLEEILSQADDLKIDIPKIWDYLAEILGDLICEEVLPLDRLHKSFKVLISQGSNAAELLVPLFKLVVSEKGPNFLQNAWQTSGLQLTDFMPSAQVDSFIKDHQFEFLIGGGAPVGQNQLTYDQIESKLLDFLKSKKPRDDIVNWITANVGDRVKENKFIRALATAIFRDSINDHLKMVPDTLSAHTNLLFKYVECNPTYELQCLHALRALIHKMEHPQGLLLSICDKLYEMETFSQESFISWEISTDPAEQEGKGVALKQLTSFFTQLKENDEDDEEEEEEYVSSGPDDAA